MRFLRDRTPGSGVLGISLAALLLVALLCPRSARPWPGAHRTLGCGDCHAAPPVEHPEPGALHADERVELCLRCHGTLGRDRRDDKALLLGHPGWGSIPTGMYEHYGRWLEKNRGSYDPPLEAEDLPVLREGPGHRFDCLTCHPSRRGSSGYSRIGLAALELCTACHGGESPVSDPGLPRILYAPAHLGSAAAGAEHGAPTGALRSGAAPPGVVYLPLAVFARVHTNPREGLGYVVEVDLGRDGELDLQEYVTETTPRRLPMRWQTGNPPRWEREAVLHRLAAFWWPKGEHEVRLIPYDGIRFRHGVAHRFRVPGTAGSLVLDPISKGLACGGVFRDRLLRTWEDDAGNVLRLYCADGGWSVDEFRLFFGTPADKGRLVGRCAAEEGVNADWVLHTGDRDGNGRIDAFLGTLWRSQIEVALSAETDTVEWKSYEYDGVADRLVLKRYHSDDGPGGESPDLLREELEDVDPMDFDWVLERDPKPDGGPARAPREERPESP